jgi:uncharacterized protein YbbK (DUF523 family)
VSACLLGTHCNHEAGHSRGAAVVALAATHRLVPICPEVCGGLPTPRPAAERNGDRVVTAAGDDVTAEYQRGARVAVELAQAVGARRAVLKARSPSCGGEQIYDGTFTRTRSRTQPRPRPGQQFRDPLRDPSWSSHRVAARSAIPNARETSGDRSGERAATLFVVDPALSVTRRATLNPSHRKFRALRGRTRLNYLFDRKSDEDLVFAPQARESSRRVSR